MPPSAVKTYEDLICYEYAKLIAAAADMENNYGFIMDRMKKLRQGEIEMSDVVREDRYTVEQGKEECIYCGAAENLTWDHIIPLDEGRGPGRHQQPDSGLPVLQQQQGPPRHHLVVPGAGHEYPPDRVGQVPQTGARHLRPGGHARRGTAQRRTRQMVRPRRRPVDGLTHSLPTFHLSSSFLQPSWNRWNRQIHSVNSLNHSEPRGTPLDRLEGPSHHRIV